jgi:hypothetical protein
MKGDPILDIGVSDEITEEANLLEKRYPHQSDVTCAGLGDGAAVRAAYPEIGYARIVPNEPLPFADRTFRIATCNAVIEHVGDHTRQKFLIGEMLRVAEFVFVSLPNRWFPLEHHTSLPLVHYVPPIFYRLCAATHLAHWSTPDNVRFLSKTAIAQVWPKDEPLHMKYSGLRLGLFSSNLVCHNRGAGIRTDRAR